MIYFMLQYSGNLRERGVYDEEDDDSFGLLVCSRLGLLPPDRSGRSGVESH